MQSYFCVEISLSFGVVKLEKLNSNISADQACTTQQGTTKTIKFGLPLIGNHYRQIHSCSTGFPLDYHQFSVQDIQRTNKHTHYSVADAQYASYVHGQMCNIQY